MARFQSTFKKTVFTFLAIGIMCVLGAWQLHRSEWKTALIKTIDERKSMQPLNQIPRDGNYAAIEYRRAAITGLVDDSKMVFLGPRTRGTENGYYMYVPMVLPDKRVLLVNRGFIPNQYLNMIKPGRAGIQAVSGTLKQPALPGLFTPKNEDEGKNYFWLDLRKISEHFGTPTLMPVTLELDQIAASQYSMGAAQEVTLDNNHFQYALTWFGLAFIALIYYIISGRRQPGIIEAGFRMHNPNLDQGMPFGRDKKFKNDDSLWS